MTEETSKFFCSYRLLRSPFDPECRFLISTPETTEARISLVTRLHEQHRRRIAIEDIEAVGRPDAA